MISLLDALKKFVSLPVRATMEVTPAPKLDLTRRHFVFGASATIILPTKKSYFILPPSDLIIEPEKPQLVLPTDRKLFDLPTREAMALTQKLLDGQYDITAIPRWVVLDKEWFDKLVPKDFQDAREAERVQRLEERKRRYA